MPYICESTPQTGRHNWCQVLTVPENKTIYFSLATESTNNFYRFVLLRNSKNSKLCFIGSRFKWMARPVRRSFHHVVLSSAYYLHCPSSVPSNAIRTPFVNRTYMH